MRNITAESYLNFSIHFCVVSRLNFKPYSNWSLPMCRNFLFFYFQCLMDGRYNTMIGWQWFLIWWWWWFWRYITLRYFDVDQSIYNSHVIHVNKWFILFINSIDYYFFRFFCTLLLEWSIWLPCFCACIGVCLMDCIHTLII